MVSIAITGFFAQKQTKKGLIFPKDLFGGQHQNGDGLVLRMFFLTFSCANIEFAESSSKEHI